MRTYELKQEYDRISVQLNGKLSDYDRARLKKRKDEIYGLIRMKLSTK